MEKIEEAFGRGVRVRCCQEWIQAKDAKNHRQQKHPTRKHECLLCARPHVTKEQARQQMHEEHGTREFGEETTGTGTWDRDEVGNMSSTGTETTPSPQRNRVGQGSISDRIMESKGYLQRNEGRQRNRHLERDGRTRRERYTHTKRSREVDGLTRTTCNKKRTGAEPGQG